MDCLRDSRDVGWIWKSGYVSGIRLEIHGAVLLNSSISILVMRTGLAITINIVLSFSFIIHPSHYQQNKNIYGGNALTPMLTLTLTLVMMLLLLLLEEEEEDDDDDDDGDDDDDDDDDVSSSSSPSWCIAFGHQKITISCFCCCSGPPFSRSPAPRHLQKCYAQVVVIGTLGVVTWVRQCNFFQDNN